MSTTRDRHPLAGRTVRLNDRATDPRGQVVPCAEIVIEDWWIRVAGQSWTTATGNLAACNYGLRAGMTGLPADDDVLYGKLGGLGVLVHVSELGAEVPPPGAPPERRCRRCGARTGLRRLIGSPLATDGPEWECHDGCEVPA